MKRPEYEDLKVLIASGHIKDIAELIRRIEPKLWYADIGITYKTYMRRKEAPGTFKADEIITLGNILETDPAIIFTLVHRATQKKKGKK